MTMVDSLFLREPVKGIQIRRSKKELPTFITEERAQKFDLLVHLLAYLKQPLIVCGPHGIGKTTVLAELKALKADEWPIVVVSGTDRLSFELIQELLWQKIRQQPLEFDTPSLTYSLQHLEALNQPVVLMVDDAGQLVSGLMTSLEQYAATYSCIRLVFAMTNDELQQKQHTEHLSGELQFIELPVLSLSQTKAFVTDLLAEPDQKSLVDIKKDRAEKSINNVVNDVMVKQIHKKTNGVPGKIVEELPHFLGRKSMRGSSWIYILVFACAITVGVAALLWKSTNPEQDKSTFPLNHAEDSATVAAPLAIPGQVHVEPQKSSDASASALALPGNKNPSLPPLPEIKKSDYYTGYARVREKDALDEYQANKDSAFNSESVTEQPKVEIIAPEPTLATPASLPVQKAPELAANVEHSLEPQPAAIAKMEPKLKPIELSTHANAADKPKTKAEASAKLKPMVKEAIKTPISEQKLTENSVKNLPVVKPEVKQFIADKPKLKSLERTVSDKAALQKIKPPQQQDSAEKSKVTPVAKIEPREVNLSRQAADIAVEKHPKADNQEPFEGDVVKDSTVLETENTHKAVKIEGIKPSEKALDPIKPPKLETLPSETTLSNKMSVAEKSVKVSADDKVNEPSGPAKLGVVMKYKSGETKSDKAVKPPESPSVAKSTDDNFESAGKKSSGANYTLQVMVFSQQQTLQGFMAKHKGLGSNLRYVTTQKEGVERYIVTYGSFNSLTEANLAKQKLPADFKQALARKR